MTNEELTKIHSDLTVQVKEYIEAIIEEYSSYMPEETLNRLISIDDYSKIVKIYETGSINASASRIQINMPLCADRVLTTFSKVPGYGIHKKHKSYTDETLIENNNTFIHYVLHTFISGTDAKGYYEDLLLHETMHYCGSGGASALKEGINELLTRKLALKKNFRTNGCGYPNEVKLALELQNLFGEDIINKIAFIDSNRQIYQLLEEELGTESAVLYVTIERTADKIFDKIYYKKMHSYDGITGILRKIVNYLKVDYTEVYEILTDYKEKQLITTNNQKMKMKNR